MDINISMEKLSKSNFFLTMLNPYFFLQNKLLKFFKWLQMIRYSLLNIQFNVENHNNKVWFSLFLNFFQPYVTAKFK